MNLRGYAAILLCFCFGLTTPAKADNLREVESAVDRWAEGGSGGTPDYVRHIVPLFSKLGCNNRACHGSFQGQSGFRLSLFGFEPTEDWKTLLIDDGDGLRANVQKPDASLVLFKPTNEDEHGGGRRMQTGSWQHRMFRQWIADGAKYDPKQKVQVPRLEISPGEIIADRTRKVSVALRAVAHFSDGTVEDVTGLTVFSSNDEAVAKVAESGEVTVGRLGDTAIIARYAGAVTSTQVLVPAADHGTQYPQTYPHSKIDEFVGARLRKLNIHPSELSSDADFIRRAYLDVIGMLPTAEETRTFLEDRAPDKRAKIIDLLLEHPAYARYWGMKFSDWTGNSKYINNQAILSNWLWQQWIEEKLSRNVAYDEIVYGYVCATSLEGRPRDEFLAEAKTILHRAAGRYSYDDDGVYARRRTNELYWSNVERRNPDTMVLQTANSFLGLRLECAQCHNHPFDRWTQNDFEQFKSFFMMVRFCDPATGEELRGGGGRGYGIETVEPGVTWRYVGTVRKTPPKLLGGPEVPYSEDVSDPRVALWEWMRAPENPFFAPSFVNRIWHHYFGTGIVDPPDDFNQGNPPSNPPLLSWLADQFIEHKFDIKHVHRLILSSRTYQLTWKPNDSNRLDKKNFSHAQLRRMPAEVLIDAIADVTGVPYDFGRLPKDTPQRAVGQAMPALRYGSTRGGYPMKIFGRPDREKTCDCERSNEPSVAQALYLINDQEILSKLDDSNGRLPKLLKSTTDDRELITELYLTTLSRFPTDEEVDIQLEHVAAAPSRADGMKDVLWSLMNVREFVFVH
jgi:hypothetical protein